MWNPNRTMEFYSIQNPGTVPYNGLSARISTSSRNPTQSHSQSQIQNLPKRAISSGYPFISGYGPQYRPTPLLQVAPMKHQYETRPVIHSLRLPNQHHQNSVLSNVIGHVGQGITTTAPSHNFNNISRMANVRDGRSCGTNGVLFSATPMTPEGENIDAVTSIMMENRPLSPQPSTSGLVRRPKKRKSIDNLDHSSYGGKVFINEEKMANCLQDLSLASNQCTAVFHKKKPTSPVASLPLSSWLLDPRKPTDARRIIEEIDSRLSVDDIESDAEGDEGVASVENNNNNEPEVSRLIIPKEIEMGLGHHNILPNSLLEQITKPSMEMVLWKPPGDFVKEAVTSSLKRSVDTCISDFDSQVCEISIPSQTKDGQSRENSCSSLIRDIRSDTAIGLMEEDLFDSVDDEMEL